VSLPTVCVARQRAQTVDDHGESIPDWSDAAEAEIDGCIVQPLTGEELLLNRDANKTLLKLWAPAGTDLLRTDRVKVGDHTYEVSDIQEWSGNRLKYLSALLTRWEG